MNIFVSRYYLTTFLSMFLGYLPRSGVNVSKTLVRGWLIASLTPSGSPVHRNVIPICTSINQWLWQCCPFSAHLPQVWVIIFFQVEGHLSRATLSLLMSFKHGSWRLCVYWQNSAHAHVRGVRKLGKKRTFDPQAALSAGEGKRGPLCEVGLDSCFSETQSLLNCPSSQSPRQGMLPGWSGNERTKQVRQRQA